MKIKILVAHLIIFYLATFSLYSQDQTTKSDLMNIGAISVTIGGSFPINGTYPAFITERVDAFVSRMYAQAIDLYQSPKQNGNDSIINGLIKNHILNN